MPKRKRTYKRRRRRSRKTRRVTPSTVRSIVRRAIKPTQNVVRLAARQPETNLSSNLVWFHLNGIVNHQRIFGATGNDTQANQAKHTSMLVDWVVRAGNEDEGTDLTIYLVSLKNDIKDDVFNGLTGQISLTTDQDYNIGNGAAYVNPRVFNIHKRYKILFPARSTAVDPRFNLYKRGFIKMKPGHYIKNERGDWGTLHCPQKPSHNYYFLVFNNNSGLDSEYPTFEYNTLSTYIC